MSKFPDKSYTDAEIFSKKYFEAHGSALLSVDNSQISRAAALIEATVLNGKRIFSCGNGGSAAIANHLACDCLKGIRTNTTIAPIVYSLSSSIELITAISNDISYEDIFSYQIESLLEKDDLLIVISSSGESKNIIKAIEISRTIGVFTIGLTGFDGGYVAKNVDISLNVDSDNYGIVEDIHQSIMHILAQFLRAKYFLDHGNVGKTRF
jgi:D-sedoheptulose 7-phosphate isomerase